MRKLDGSDGFLIYQEASAIYIVGASPKGVLNGAYRFLEEVTDLIFVRPARSENGSGTVYGSRETLEYLSGKQHLRLEVPALKDHRYYSHNNHPESLRWQNRNCNLTPVTFMKAKDLKVYSECASMGVKWIFPVGLGTLIPKAKYWETHPEFFPLINGKREAGKDYNLCFMNPDLPAEAAKQIALYAEGLPAKVQISGFGHGDHGIVCRCELCSAPIQGPDGVTIPPGAPNFYSTQYAIFVNRVAKLLAETHPEITLGGGGYLFTADAPGVRPEPNTALCLCPYPDRKMKFPIYAPENAIWRDRAEAWASLNGIPHVYEFFLCSTTPQFYHPVSEIVRKDLLYYQKHGIRGFYLDTAAVDGHQSASEYAFDMSAMEYYVISRLMWDPSLSVDALRREFCRRAYREAADSMYSFYSLIQKNYYARSVPGGSWRDHPNATLDLYVIKSGSLDSALGFLDKAEEEARHPASRELITRLRNRFVDLLPDQVSKDLDTGLLVPKVETPPENPQVNGPDWTGAALIDLTRFAGNRQGRNSMGRAPENFRSEIRLMHDGKNLYIGWIFEDPPCTGANVRETPSPPGPQERFSSLRTEKKIRSLFISSLTMKPICTMHEAMMNPGIASGVSRPPSVRIFSLSTGALSLAFPWRISNMRRTGPCLQCFISPPVTGPGSEANRTMSRHTAVCVSRKPRFYPFRKELFNDSENQNMEHVSAVVPERSAFFPSGGCRFK